MHYLDMFSCHNNIFNSFNNYYKYLLVYSN
jgi:hypothetical protein